MVVLPWRKKELETPLSTYVDNELDTLDLDEIGEQVVFDPEVRDLLDSFRSVKELVNSALEPERVLEADQMVQRLETQVESPTSDDLPRNRRTRRRRSSATILASVGLLVTAGVTFVGLRRRGLV